MKAQWLEPDRMATQLTWSLVWLQNEYGVEILHHFCKIWVFDGREASVCLLLPCDTVRYFWHRLYINVSQELTDRWTVSNEYIFSQYRQGVISQKTWILCLMLGHQIIPGRNINIVTALFRPILIITTTVSDITPLYRFYLFRVGHHRDCNPV
jgi:hypothetical protein